MAITDLKLYEKANKEIIRIKSHNMEYGMMTINLDELDPITKAELKHAILTVFNKRQPDIIATISGIK